MKRMSWAVNSFCKDSTDRDTGPKSAQIHITNGICFWQLRCEESFGQSTAGKSRRENSSQLCDGMSGKSGLAQYSGLISTQPALRFLQRPKRKRYSSVPLTK